MLEILAPSLIGAVIGWIIFYFIRRYKKFTPSVLIATLAAVIGGDGISFLITMEDHFGSRDFHLWYFAGVGIGFFLYCIYVLLVAIFHNRGRIKDKNKFDKFLNDNLKE